MGKRKFGIDRERGEREREKERGRVSGIVIRERNHS